MERHHWSSAPLGRPPGRRKARSRSSSRRSRASGFTTTGSRGWWGSGGRGRNVHCFVSGRSSDSRPEASTDLREHAGAGSHDVDAAERQGCRRFRRRDASHSTAVSSAPVEIGTCEIRERRTQEHLEGLRDGTESARAHPTAIVHVRPSPQRHRSRRCVRQTVRQLFVPSW